MDYLNLVSEVREVIQDASNGNQITLTRLNDEPLATGSPWTVDNTSRFDNEVPSLSLRAVSVPLSSAGSLGLKADLIELHNTLSAVYIVEPVFNVQTDIESYQILTDGDLEYKIAFIDKLRPADVDLLYYIGAEK